MITHIIITLGKLQVGSVKSSLANLALRMLLYNTVQLLCDIRMLSAKLEVNLVLV